MGSAVQVWLVSNGDYWKAVWNTPAGRASKSLGPKASISNRQARVLCRDLGQQLAGDTRRGATVPRLSAWLETYTASRTDVKETTRGTYRECGYYLRAFFDADPPIDKINRADAADWRSELASGNLTHRLNELAMRDEAFRNRAGRKWRLPKLPTVARHVRAAKLMFGEAANQDRILFNPFDRLSGAPPKVRRDWKQITADDMEAIDEACPNQGWRCLFALCRWAGLRRGEAIRLRWQDIDWNRNRMSINFDVPEETTKVRRRVVPIEPAKCPTGLTALLLESFRAAATLRVCDVTENNVRRDALGIIRRAGIEPYAKPFHTLRKCRETELAQQYPQHVVSEWIGHDITVSADHYLRVPEELYASVQDGHGRGTEQRKLIERPVMKRRVRERKASA